MATRTTGANPLVSGGKNYFQNLNLAAGIPGTTFDATYENSTQENICGTIELLGGTLDGTDSNQLGPLLQSSFATLNGSGAEPFAVAPATTGNKAVPLAQAQALFFSTQHNETASRAFATTYTNSTGLPMWVFVDVTTNVAAGNLWLYVDGNPMAEQAGSSAAAGINISVAGIVPPGATYSVSMDNQTPALASWWETY